MYETNLSKIYGSLDRDLKWRTGVEMIPFPCHSADNFNISINALEFPLDQGKKRGLKVRGIIISNPSNPAGNLLDREILYSLVDFAREKNIHLICNEIFIGSAHGNEEFLSVAQIIDSKNLDSRDSSHCAWALKRSLPSWF